MDHLQEHLELLMVRRHLVEEWNNSSGAMKVVFVVVVVVLVAVVVLVVVMVVVVVVVDFVVPDQVARLRHRLAPLGVHDIRGLPFAESPTTLLRCEILKYWKEIKIL